VLLVHEEEIRRRLIRDGAQEHEVRAFLERTHQRIRKQVATSKQRFQMWSFAELQWRYLRANSSQPHPSKNESSSRPKEHGMSNAISSATTVHKVDYLDRPGIGPVYRAVISIKTLADLLRKAVVRYSPLYQRGFKRVTDDPHAYDVLLPITDPTLQIDHR